MYIYSQIYLYKQIQYIYIYYRERDHDDSPNTPASFQQLLLRHAQQAVQLVQALPWNRLCNGAATVERHLLRTNGDFTMDNGDFTAEHDDFPRENGDFIGEHGDSPRTLVI